MQLGNSATRYESARQPISVHGSGAFVASVSLSGLVLRPVAVLAGVLGAWRLGADAGWTNGFFIADGVFSRYQLWFAVAIAAQTSAFVLNRWAANQRKDLPVLATPEPWPSDRKHWASRDRSTTAGSPSETCSAA